MKRTQPDSARLADDADTPLSVDQLDWADLIVAMEASHRRRLMQRHRQYLKGKHIVVLDIPHNYSFMQSELIEVLLRKVGPLLL